jgi:hypothetical protein
VLRTKELNLIERNQALTPQSRINRAAEYVKYTSSPHIYGEIRINCYSATRWLDEDHFVISLIDVSGHGVRAALLSVSVMNALSSQPLQIPISKTLNKY